MGLFSKGDEDEAELMRKANIIYRIMEMIYDNRGRDSLGDVDVDRWFSGQMYPATDYIKEGVEQGWIRRAGDGIEITEYGKEYEVEYWKSFR